MVGLFIGNLAHLLHGNGGGWKGGKGKPAGDAAGSGGPSDRHPTGHNPAWQAWMPRAYQEQKDELEKFRKQEQEVKQKKAISAQVKEGISALMDNIMGGSSGDAKAKRKRDDREKSHRSKSRGR
eukprot:1878791-Alexandrium_andersonii.AAC.1